MQKESIQLGTYRKNYALNKWQRSSCQQPNLREPYRKHYSHYTLPNKYYTAQNKSSCV